MYKTELIKRLAKKTKISERLIAFVINAWL